MEPMDQVVQQITVPISPPKQSLLNEITYTPLNATAQSIPCNEYRNSLASSTFKSYVLLLCLFFFFCWIQYLVFFFRPLTSTESRMERIASSSNPKQKPSQLSAISSTPLSFPTIRSLPFDTYPNPRGSSTFKSYVLLFCLFYHLLDSIFGSLFL